MIERVLRRAASQRGFTLIEMLVSASLLIVVLTGVLAGFDASGRITSYEQQRSEADALARQDEDRLRGMSVTELSGAIPQASPVTFNGTTFTTTSSAQWQTEATGSSSCSSTGSADYLLTTSTVTWTGVGGGSHSITAQSIITPQAGGGLIVQVTNLAGNGVPNQPVTITGPSTGPSTQSANTGTNGCAIFSGLTGGTYTVTTSQTGYVDPMGNSTDTANVSVVEGSSATKGFTFDQAGTLQAAFTTVPYSGGSPVATNGDQLVATNVQMGQPGYRDIGTLGTYTATVASSTMYPFGSTYNVYPGSCEANDPANFGATDQTAQVTGGGSTNMTFQVPPMYVTVWSGTASSPGSVVSGAKVYVKDQGCGGSSVPYSSGGTPPVSRLITTNSSGQLANPGFPYGTYTVCLANSNNTAHYSYPSTVTNSNLAGTTIPLYVGAEVAGACP